MTDGITLRIIALPKSAGQNAEELQHAFVIDDLRRGRSGQTAAGRSGQIQITQRHETAQMRHDLWPAEHTFRGDNLEK